MDIKSDQTLPYFNIHYREGKKEMDIKLRTSLIRSLYHPICTTTNNTFNIRRKMLFTSVLEAR